MEAEIAIIGGTGFESLVKHGKWIRLGTPYGIPPPVLVGEIRGRKVAFLSRHGLRHEKPPHKVNYRANIYALHSLGVRRILATNAVGAINPNFRPGDLVIPHDIIDFTKSRQSTFYEDEPVVHVDVSQPFCPEVRAILIEEAKKQPVRVHDRAVLVCTEGPRFETPAEIEMFRRLGCDIVGMTAAPEAFLARELEICYATVCFVSNMAAGMQARLTVKEVFDVASRVSPVIQQILSDAVERLPQERHCPCSKVLRDAGLGGETSDR